MALLYFAGCAFDNHDLIIRLCNNYQEQKNALLLFLYTVILQTFLLAWRFLFSITMEDLKTF